MKRLITVALSFICAAAFAFGAVGCAVKDGDKGSADSGIDTPSDGGQTTPDDEEKDEGGDGGTDVGGDSGNGGADDGNPENPIKPDPDDTGDGGETTEPDDTGSGVPQLTYKQKMERYFDGVEQTAFTGFVTALAPYSDGEAVKTNALYASPDGNGDGTLDDPCSLQDGLDEVKAGGVLYLRGGEYDPKQADGYFVSCKGSAGNYVTIRNYPNERAVIKNSYSGSEAYGFQFEAGAAYIIFEGIEICSVQSQCAYGIVFWGEGQNNIIIRNCDIHDIKTTSARPDTDDDAGANAILLFGETSSPITDIAIIDNHCHENVNGWSENISVTANCERVYVIGNLVENNTNIGIDFYGNAGYCKTASLDQPRNCLAAGNRVLNCNCSYADCAGLYVDGARDVLLQNNFISGCSYGIEIGCEERQDDYPVKNITVRNNLCQGNTLTALRIGGYEKVATGVVTSTVICNNTFVGNCSLSDGAEIILAKVDGIDFFNNVVSAKAECVLVSTDFTAEYTQNVSFKNNLFFISGGGADDAEFDLFGSAVNGLGAFNAVFGGNNIYGDPLLGEDYTPAINSPCIGAGASEVDIGRYDFALNERSDFPPSLGCMEKKG